MNSKKIDEARQKMIELRSSLPEDIEVIRRKLREDLPEKAVQVHMMVIENDYPDMLCITEDVPEDQQRAVVHMLGLVIREMELVGLHFP